MIINRRHYQSCLSSMRLSCIRVFIILLIRNFCVSQFHQDDYNIILDRFDVLKVNKSAAPTLILKVFKYNDTLKMKAINLTLVIKQEVRKNILLSFAAYKSVNKIYRPFPIPSVTIDVCEEYTKLGERNPFGIQSLISSSNYNGCPCAPGLYYLNAFILQDDKFPPHVPGGDYKLIINGVFDDRFIFDAALYNTIVKKKSKQNRH